MDKRRIPTICVCGAYGHTAGMNTLLDGTKKRRYQCRQCGNRWMVVISGPTVPSKKRNARTKGLWMRWCGYWYSPEEQAQIRESARMGGLI